MGGGTPPRIHSSYFRDLILLLNIAPQLWQFRICTLKRDFLKDQLLVLHSQELLYKLVPKRRSTWVTKKVFTVMAMLKKTSNLGLKKLANACTLSNYASGMSLQIEKFAPLKMRSCSLFSEFCSNLTAKNGKFHKFWDMLPKKSGGGGGGPPPHDRGDHHFLLTLREWIPKHLELLHCSCPFFYEKKGPFSIKSTFWARRKLKFDSAHL